MDQKTLINIAYLASAREMNAKARKILTAPYKKPVAPVQPETPYEKARRESETQARFNLPDEPMRLTVRQKRCPEHGALPILVKNSPDHWKMECPEVGCLRSTPTVKTSYAAICHWNAAILLET